MGEMSLRALWWLAALVTAVTAIGLAAIGQHLVEICGNPEGCLPQIFAGLGV
ncbi:MAG TPA: hypothetical protein VMT89_01385 [Candidatus Acidoferrales bacterium]|nr:hypothetical protein [Candidatus Acidoferrales bacterium]